VVTGKKPYFLVHQFLFPTLPCYIKSGTLFSGDLVVKYWIRVCNLLLGESQQKKYVLKEDQYFCTTYKELNFL